METNLQTVIKPNLRKIAKLIKPLTNEEYNFLQWLIGIRNTLNHFILKGYTKEQLCEKFGIDKNQYFNFMHGDFNYNTEHVSAINSLLSEIETNEAVQAEIQAALEKTANEPVMIVSKSRKPKTKTV